MNSESTPIQLFLSYARADDEEFGLVDPLVSKLKAFVKVKSGRSLDVFVDRESIGWGEDWRERLSESVEAATVFMPLLTATYLDRPACREEFLAFHSKAEVLGVTDLLLPILVFKSPLFSDDNADEIVQIAESRQYKCIEDPLIAGFDSASWVQCTKDLAESLLAALTKAESALTSPAALAATVPEPPSETTVVDEDDTGGLAELMEQMQGAVDDMTAAAEGLAPAMDAFAEAPDSVGDLPNEPSAKQVKAWTLRLANVFSEPAKALEERGREMFAAAKRLDEAMIGIRQLVDEVDDEELSQPLREGLQELVANFGDLTEAAATMDELLTSMKPAELLSVPLRKSLQPARRGLTSVLDTLRLIESWQIPPSGEIAGASL